MYKNPQSNYHYRQCGSWFATGPFGNSIRVFYISDKGVADELYSGQIRLIRLASLMVSVYEDKRLYDI